MFSRIRWRRSHLAALLLGLATAGAPAKAEIVRLKLASGTFGQGWMFLDTDGVCKVVTAGHVIHGIGGGVRQPLVFDANGQEWPTAKPTLDSTLPDVAVLPVPAANDPSVCGSGRFSPIGVSRRIANFAGGLIRTTGDTEIRDIPVARRASEIDKKGSTMFAVRPTIAGDVVTKGWSGSVVLDGDGPLGIVFEVDPEANEAYAVRTDAIRTLMATAPVSRTGPDMGMPQPLISTKAGTTVDPASGPDQFTAGKTWQVTPKQRAVVFVLHYANPTQVRQVQLVSDPGPNGIEAIDVSTEAEVGADSWIWGNFCRAAPGAPGATCPFLLRTVTAIRVLVKTHNDGPIGLAGLDVK